MAGGMDRRSEYGTMPTELPATAMSDRPLCLPVRRQAEGGWRGRVVHPVQEDGAWVIVEEWLASGLLDPVRESQ